MFNDFYCLKLLNWFSIDWKTNETILFPARSMVSRGRRFFNRGQREWSNDLHPELCRHFLSASHIAIDCQTDDGLRMKSRRINVWRYSSRSSTSANGAPATIVTWPLQLALSDDHWRNSRVYRQSEEVKWTCGLPNGSSVAQSHRRRLGINMECHVMLSCSKNHVYGLGGALED